MTTLYHGPTFCLLVVAALVIGTVGRASEPLSGGPTTGKSNEVRIVNREAEEKKSFADLWQQYATATSPEYRRMMLMILTSRSSREVSPEIDRELCSRFEDSPDPDTALLLGVCSSGRSHHLLSTHEKTTSQALSNAVLLALARRGNATAATAFVEEFLRQPVGRGEPVDWATDHASRESIRNLEYIGSPRCILALYDATVSIQEKGTNAVLGATAPASAMVANMRDFLSRIDVPMSGKADNQEIVDWWKENRTEVSTRLNEKGTDLPRLKPMRIVISRD